MEQSGQVDAVIREIAASSEEEVEQLNLISTGAMQISSVTQTTSSVSEETASAAAELDRQTGRLTGIVSEYKL